ncbi:hypothetical protein PAPYR_4460 [Paratrimastix pyriformis]|uniref:Uncharacterized protein n=1 Tax=Paratrimastix pyriformis TaxID=342808 RepID=A0ABQ8UJL4_9EUKA|nr:hypothetical protein PAPYR_4460 [Paratrimastix pyriformis]
MNSIDWNQFHTPKKPLSIARVRSARTPEMGRGLPGDQLPLGAGLMTPYHLELIRQTFDGLFRPSSPDSAGKDLLLIGGEEDEPEREEPSSVSRPAATHTAPGAPPAPTPTAPKAPTALTARPTTPASGAVEHKDKELEPLGRAAPAAAKPKKDREAPEEGKKAAPVAAKSKKEAAKEAKAAAPAPPPPARRKPGPPHEAKEAAEAKGSDDAPRRTPGRGTGTSTRPQWRSPPRRRTRAAAPEPKAKAERGPGRPTRTTSPRRPLAKYCSPSLISGGLFDLSLSEKCHGKRAHVLLSSIDPCPSLARPLAYERLGAIVEWFQVARIIVDPRRVSELPPEITAEQRTELRQRVEKLNKLHPQIRQHLKEDYIDVAVYNTLDPEAMLELQHRVNLLTHDARFGSSTFDVLLNLKRASLQAPKRYIREDPDFATHLEPALKELHFPKGEDAPAKLVKILECFSLEMLCALSQLPVERQPSATNLWRIFEARDAEMNRWLARAMLEGSFSGSEATSTAAADLKKPIRQAEQTFMLLEAHDAAEVAAGDHPPVLYLPPDEAAREILRCHLGLMDRAFPELEWKSILSNKVGTVYLQRLCLSLGVDYESPSKKTTLIAQLAPLLAERHFTPQKVLQILKLQSWIDISASGFQAPLITPPASAAGSGPAGAAPGPEKSDGPTAPPMQLEVGSTGERSTAVLVTPGSTPAGPVAPFFDFESSLPPLMGMEPTVSPEACSLPPPKNHWPRPSLLTARSLKTTLRVRGLAVCPRLPPTQQTRNENSPRSGHTSSSRPSSRPSSSSRQQQAQQRQAQQQQAQQQQAQQQAQQQVQQRQAQQRQAQQQQAQQQQAQQQQAQQQQAQQQQQQAQQQQQQAQQQQAQQQQQQAQQQQAQQQAQQQQAQQQQAQQQQAQQQQAQQQQQQQRRQRQQQQQQQQAQQQAQQQPSSSRPSSSSSRPSSSRPSSSRPSSPSRRSTRPQRPRAAAGREDIETLLEPNAPDDVLDDILWQVPADWYWSCLRGLGASCPRGKLSEPDRRRALISALRRHGKALTLGDLLRLAAATRPSTRSSSGHRPLATPEPPPSPQRRIPAGVTNDDGQSCAYAATVQLLAGLRLRAPGPVEASLRGTPVLEVIGAAVAAAAHPSTTTAVDIRPVVTAVSRDMPHIRARRGAYADASELMLAVLSAARRPDLFRASSRGTSLCAKCGAATSWETPESTFLLASSLDPLRVDKCSCGGQLRELSAVKPAPVLVVTVDKLAGVIARAFKTGRLEREGWPSFRLVGGLRHIGSPTTGHETAIFRTNDGALFDLSGTRRTEVTTSDVEEGLRLLVFVVERDVTTAATILKAAPWAAAPAPTPIPSHDQAALPTPATPPTSAAPSAPTAVRDAESDPTQPPSAPAHPTPVAQQAGPGSSSLPLPSTGPPHPQTSAPSPSDQATTNTPEEEHQDHTGAPLNHNRPRSSEDFVIFYPRGRQEMDKGPKPVAVWSRRGWTWASFASRAEAESAMQTATRKAMWAKSTAERLGIRVEARRRRHTPGTPTGDTDRPATGRGGPFELYFPDGAPDGLTPAPTAVRTSREGQAWAVFSSLEDATAARAGASTRVAWSKATAARLNLPPEATSPRLPQAPSTVSPTAAGAPRLGRAGLQRAAAATPAGATAIRAENTETDDEAGTDEAETGPRGATQRRRRARGGSRRRGPTGIPLTWAQVEALQPLRNARARTVRPIRPGMRGPASTLPPTNAMGYPPETVFILPNSMPMAQLTLADGRPFRH